MQKLSHPNIVSLLEVINESNSFFLVMEKCDMDLKKYLTKFRLSERKSVEILRQLLAGFSKLVEKGYIHRDLKPANILITSKLEFKLADFGMAKYVDHYDTALLQTLVGTPLYMSPQILMGQSYTTKCDIWSLGCIFYEMLTGVSPWTANTEQALLRNILNKPLAVPQGGSKWSTDLLQKMLMIK